MAQGQKSYNRQQIIQRDNGVCWLCGNRVDLKLKSPHPLSPTIDHVIPKSRGGASTASNVALSHKVCNENKKDKMPWEEFKLPEGILFREYGSTALLLYFDSDDELLPVVEKLSRTRNKKLKNAMKNIIQFIR